MDTSVRKLLILGATGKQGSAVINALVASPPPWPHEILAVTRNPQSAAAQKLISKAKNLTVLTGDQDDCPAIFRNAGGPGAVWGVFSVQVAAMTQGKGAPKDIEEKQGMTMVDAALEAGVKHFVYTSVDRGGSDSIRNPTNVPHFISKHIIEEHLINSVEDETKNKQGMTYTILRPVAFFDNFTPDFMGKGFSAMWSNLGPTPLQMVSTRDIGIFAAQSFASFPPDNTPTHPTVKPHAYKNAAISLAGDELTHQQGSSIFKKVFEKPMPTTFGFVGSMILFMMKEMGVMFKWFKDVGYKADMSRCRELNPRMQDFETWLREESGFAESKDQK